jgi:hypothetical protein
LYAAPAPERRVVVSRSRFPFPVPVRFSKSAPTPSPFSFSRVVHSTSFFLLPSPSSSLSHSPPGQLIGSFGSPPDNANWSQSSAPRPSCLVPLPLVISLIVHLCPRSHPFAPFPPSFITSSPTFCWPYVVTIPYQQLSLAAADTTSLPIPQAQNSFSAEQSLSLPKTGCL